MSMGIILELGSKETWAFITWIVFAIYLHTRTNKNLQGANSAIVATLGFSYLWICYFGVNLLGMGY
uniref:Putative cytochrome c assembly protein n=1 Tax=Helianthus annuus TaxID=4232 RepID=A0A1Y3BWN5_HELAN